MSFKIAMLVCFILMCLISCITYYLGKKVSKKFIKYIPVFSLGSGLIFFYIKLNYSSFDHIFDKIAIILLLIVFSIALLEAIIIEVVENTKLFKRGIMVIRKSLKLVHVKKEQVRWK
ncbi:hypothetical protein SAMN05518871_101458 [Psychrobacillus sp. OK028]|uniref:hypothetical protein n=1 Tax=Psychrobacillus sp. OK028 TaxID=1884359 RepID=UPI000884A907|nr:hypothetical protein [Psychrobacillus sp. OK028]SDM52994.1 hypothetical protein SAMN05518871_101458 [Psychrobacillus sp. OK028]